MFKISIQCKQLLDIQLLNSMIFVRLMFGMDLSKLVLQHWILSTWNYQRLPPNYEILLGYLLTHLLIFESYLNYKLVFY